MGKSRIALVFILCLTLPLLFAAVSTFYIEDEGGEKLVFGTGGSLTFKNISGADNDISVLFRHVDLEGAGTNTHVQIDSHLADSSIHFTEASIDHENIQNIGSNTHAQIDSHISTANTHIADSSIHFTEASIDHENIQNIGSNTHAQIDSHISTANTHIADGSIHFSIFDNATSLYTDRAWSSQFTSDEIDARIAGVGGTAFSTLQVDGQSDLVATTDDTLEIIAGANVTITTDTGSSPKSLTIASSGGGGGGDVLDVNTTCYVATTGDDTQPCGDTGDDCLTPNGCLVRYASYKINSDVYLTIELDDGVYTLSDTIEFVHPDGTQIKLIGANVLDRSVSSIQSTSGSAGAYSIVLNLNDVTGITTNHVALIYDPSGGTNPTYLVGGWRITNVDSGNNRITISSSHQSGVPSGAVTASIRILKAVLDFETNVVDPGISIHDLKTLGWMENLACLGDDSVNVIDVTRNATINAKHIVINGGYAGFNIDLNSAAELHTVAVSDTAGAGVLFRQSSAGNVYDSMLCGNGAGLSISYGSAVVFRDDLFYSVSSGNGQGVRCEGSSMARVRLTYVTGNTSQGFYAYSNALIYQGSSVLSGNGSNYSPALNTPGNHEAYIY